MPTSHNKVFQHVMNEELNVGKARSPNIKYSFMPELLENYDELKIKGNKDAPKHEGWHNNLKF